MIFTPGGSGPKFPAMPLTIQGSRGRTPGRGLDQEPEVRKGIEAGETVYVLLNKVYFATEIDHGEVKYTALLTKPPGAD